MPVPHIGWNGIRLLRDHVAFPTTSSADALYYFVHSFRVAGGPIGSEGSFPDWALTATDYGGERFVSAVSKGNVFATQFHPEKSGKAGLALLERYNHMILKGILGCHVNDCVQSDKCKRCVYELI